MINPNSRTPLCFALTSQWLEQTLAGGYSLYAELIAPAIEAAGLEPIGDDCKTSSGALTTPHFEQFLLCPFAVVDITAATKELCFQLGLRRALRPGSTVVVYAGDPPFETDDAFPAAIALSLSSTGDVLNADQSRRQITETLIALNGAHHDASTRVASPLEQLIKGLPREAVDHLKTDIFLKTADTDQAFKSRVEAAMREGPEALERLVHDPALLKASDISTSDLVWLYLALRDAGTTGAMIELYQRMPRSLQSMKMLREQLGFALNREGRSEDAEAVLREVISEYGPSSETNALLGRVYKDRWQEAKEKALPEADTLLKTAIDTYVDGFEADWRDAYPGINAVTLMDLLPEPDKRQEVLLPVVRYAVAQRMTDQPDYWDHATLLELAVLARDEEDAKGHLDHALSAAQASWMATTTARTLSLIRKTRVSRGEESAWIGALETRLSERAKELETAGPAS